MFVETDFDEKFYIIILDMIADLPLFPPSPSPSHIEIHHWAIVPDPVKPPICVYTVKKEKLLVYFLEVS